jgi:hypothetical protein
LILFIIVLTSLEVDIRDYSREQNDAKTFKSITEEWIAPFMLPIHAKVLEDPETEILIKNKGMIFFAILDGEPVGTISLQSLEHEPNGFELVKMGVLKKAQGRRVGLVSHNILL